MEVRVSHSLVYLENICFQVIYSTLYALIFVIGIIGNGLLISSIIRRKRATVANIFLINLGIFDLVSCLIVVNTPSIASVHHHHDLIIHASRKGNPFCHSLQYAYLLAIPQFEYFPVFLIRFQGTCVQSLVFFCQSIFPLKNSTKLSFIIAAFPSSFPRRAALSITRPSLSSRFSRS